MDKSKSSRKKSSTSPPKREHSPKRERSPKRVRSPKKEGDRKSRSQRNVKSTISSPRSAGSSKRKQYRSPKPPSSRSPKPVPSDSESTRSRSSSKRQQSNVRQNLPATDGHEGSSNSVLHQASKQQKLNYNHHSLRPQQVLSPRREHFAPNYDHPNLSSIRLPSLISPTRDDAGYYKSPKTPRAGTNSEAGSQSSFPIPPPPYDDLAASHRSDYVEAPPVKEEVHRVDEAFLLYTLAENAAIRIQRNFRNKKLQEDKDIDDTDTAEDTDDNMKENLENKEEAEEPGKLMTLLFLSITALILMAGHCMSFFGSLCGGSDVEAPVPLEGTAPPPSGQGGGGGGGGVAPPPGLEAVAGQAASAAGSAASSGVATGAAAGAAASASAAAAAGAATAAVASQVATAVVVSSAVAATAVTAGLVATNLGNTTAIFVPPATSICGLFDPDVRKGQFTMVFEGFSRPFDNREKLIVENLVVEAYNNLTIGANLESVGCLDPLSREMTEAKLVNQTWDSIAEGYNPLLEAVFETTLLCDNCLALQPLFSTEKEEERRLFQYRRLEQDGIEPIDGTDLISSALFDFTSREFFQRLLQLVIFKTEDLSEIGELPDGFIQMTRAFVTPVLPENDGVSESGSGSGGNATGTGGDPNLLEAYLVTEIAYQPQGLGGDRGAFRFTYINEENGEQQTDIVVIDVNTILQDPFVEPVPTTQFPTFAPTRSPTISPSTVPTITFSGQPTREPSSKPSMAPTNIPSEVPSETPSDVPSAQPSNVPSVVPTEPPSMVPSFPPSEAPSAGPSITQSIGPTFSPSISPSAVPSYRPSDAPSVNPSAFPSMTPSYVPSTSPSMNPSSIPSMAPSMVPSVSPSLSPSGLPSSSPSRSPSASPSVEPSTTPSISPTITSWHWVACGETGGCAGDALLNSNRLTDDSGTFTAVRCCADTALTGFAKVSASCPYAASTIGGLCYTGTTWYDAFEACASVGARLCTRVELNAQCTTNTGCSHNLRPVWSSTAGTP
ncbi:unnamed protein product [Cylindrotheca closterium]|uniref:Circumsporozoite protein n=1 Tax=Cylindrotheca closterium TaxID=2856 RepID=A0AAD2GD02_9STRA|nr:unnamed protein product [Cylindrotheca closterium]